MKLNIQFINNKMFSWIGNLIGVSASEKNEDKLERKLDEVLKSRSPIELLKNELPFFLNAAEKLQKDIELQRESKIFDDKVYHVISTLLQTTVKIVKKYLKDETICIDEIKLMNTLSCDVVSFICDEKIHLDDRALHKMIIFGDWIHEMAQNTTEQSTREFGNNIYRIIQAKNKKKIS